jgi:hypothetical protein
MHSETAAKKTVEQFSVAAEKGAEDVGDSENAVSMRTIEDFVRHNVCAFDIVSVAAGGAKP